MFFQPRYLKNAKLLHKGVTRFMDYKRDLLPESKIAEIDALREELTQAIKKRDTEVIETLTEKINKTCEKALPDARVSEWAENIEVIFVSIVIALGIRSYIAQPFQIPTGSMQPTLNGFNAEWKKEDPNPGILGKALGFFTGTTYLNVIADEDGVLLDKDPTNDKYPITEEKFLIFRPYCVLHFKGGHTIKISCPMTQLLGELQLANNINSIPITEENSGPDRRTAYALRGGETIKKGQVLARGLVHNGDHVIVNKFALHFRQPSRGEVFVFTTKNIDFIERSRGGGFFDMRWGSQHYIKRLVGTPGDVLEVKSPELLINGQRAVEKGIRRVIDEAVLPARRGAYAYQGYSDDGKNGRFGPPVSLKSSPQREYFAMGDNSYSSSDSRYWGTVPEQNIVGNGWLCYWPLTRHWGLIR
ncbi:hypothetical protein BH11VER1_BH11VER1_38920 [soil metagenome]